MEVQTINELFNSTVALVLKCYVLGLGVGLAVKVFMQAVKR